MWIFDGAYHSAPVINAPLRRLVQIKLAEHGTRPERERRSRQMVARLGSPALRVVPTLLGETVLGETVREEPEK